MTINLTISQKLVSPGWDWQKTPDFPKLRFVWLCIIVKLSILVGMLLFHLKLPSTDSVGNSGLLSCDAM